MICHLLESYFVSTNLGIIKIQSCDRGLHSIHFSEQDGKHIIIIDSNYSLDINLLDNFPAYKTIQWIYAYFCKPIQLENVDQPPICPLIMPEKGSLAEAVWKAMSKEVKFGQTISYQKLAEISGHPGASRAVGNVMRKNNLLLFQPCHRVIKSDGTIGKFSAGNKYKENLLLHEKSNSHVFVSK